MTNRFVVGACAALLACGGAPRDAAPARELEFRRPYVVPGAGSAPGVLYLDIVADSADTLRAVQVAGAEAMLHDASMQMLSELPVAAAQVTRLSPGGVHAMVMLPGAPPARGSTVAVDLTFARRGRVTLQARVIDYADVDTATAPRPER